MQFDNKAQADSFASYIKPGNSAFTQNFLEIGGGRGELEILSGMEETIEDEVEISLALIPEDFLPFDASAPYALEGWKAYCLIEDLLNRIGALPPSAMEGFYPEDLMGKIELLKVRKALWDAKNQPV